MSKDDAKHLFSGAPQFMLEKGKRGRSYPQAHFPWDSDLDVADLQDRQWLKHETFGLSTLHAHLPVPGDFQSVSIASYGSEAACRRPAFDLGLFELPNMLSQTGREPGTVGMRYFLELPVADSIRSTKKLEGEKDPASRAVEVAHTPSAEAFKALEHGKGCAAVGKHAPRQDRLQLIRSGPRSWKHIGVRDVSMQFIANRLFTIGSWHDEVISKGFKVTVLDKQSHSHMHSELFGELLHPPGEITDEGDPRSLKIQIEALVRVLTTPGVWIDFSLVEWRLRVGQILFAHAAHKEDAADKAELCLGLERKWLLVQLLLSIELILRLEAVLRSGMARRSERHTPSGDEIHHFNKLRNTKLDWDLCLGRRFLDHLCVQDPSNTEQEQVLKVTPGKVGNLLSRLKHVKVHTNDSAEIRSAACVIVPRQPRSQLEGLLCFAQEIKWPSLENIQKGLEKNLHCLELPNAGVSSGEIYAVPLRKEVETDHVRNLKPRPPPTDWSSQNLADHPIVSLQPATDTQARGWLTRSWLTGLVLPGGSASHLLMSALLENDPWTTRKLGTMANLHGGFIVNGHSWWSKSCVVGRVIAVIRDGADCMGWICTPDLLPINDQGGRHVDGWLEIVVQKVPSLRVGTRIHDGVKMAEESSPLGTGHGKVLTREFLMPMENGPNSSSTVQVVFTNLVLHRVSKTTDQDIRRFSSSAIFALERPNRIPRSNITLNLVHDVYFVSAYQCRLPHGHIAPKSDKVDHHPVHQHAEHLPAHPLHQTFKYVVKDPADLVNLAPVDYTTEGSGVWVVDARESVDKEVFTRAWCSQVGRHALVARVGKICLSCCVREAKAIEVGIIIRVGRRS